jgi:hypothetical protein
MAIGGRAGFLRQPFKGAWVLPGKEGVARGLQSIRFCPLYGMALRLEFPTAAPLGTVLAWATPTTAHLASPARDQISGCFISPLTCGPLRPQLREPARCT